VKIWDNVTSPEKEEVWVELFDGRYAVSSLGAVKTRTRSTDWQDINPVRMASGYFTVGVYAERGKKPKTYLLHRLVLEAFRGVPPDGKMDARHLDGRKSNNRLENLSWGTRSENMLDVIKHRSGEKEEEPEPGEKKRRWYNGYTTDEYLVRVGCELYAEGVLTLEHLSRFWNCSRDVASNIVKGKTRCEIDRPTVKSKKRRTPGQKKQIRDLIQQGKKLPEINQILGETLTAQDLYYYRAAKGKA
jgi:hypothetical protein